MDDLLDVPAAAKRLRVSEARVKVWLQEGRIPGRKLGGVWIIPAATCKKPKKKRPGPKTVAEPQ